MKSYKRLVLFSFSLLTLLTIVGGCKKDTSTTPILETGTLTDVEGNVYKTIKIGNQWWMAENLNVKKYRNGNPIFRGQTNGEWIDTVAAYCLYDNNSKSPGLLYNWYAVKDINNIAPEGWHIPTDDEWKEMEKNLGMNQSDADKSGWRGSKIGDKLKVKSPEGWTEFSNIWSSNESGFTALAGGNRLFNGVWGDPGLYATGFWWTSSELVSGEVWYRYLDYKNSEIFRSHCLKGYGYSVRCVKDAD